MLTRENEGSKKSVRKVVQDFVHQQYLPVPWSVWGMTLPTFGWLGQCSIFQSHEVFEYDFRSVHDYFGWRKD